MTDHRSNSSGFAYSTSEWLDSHHAIKSRLRAELIAKLSINSGEQVLDLGCGTGNWSILAAERIGVRGRLIGIDSDAESLAVAQQRQKAHFLGRIMDFREARLETVEIEPSSVDVVLLFNVLSYLSEPSLLVQRARRALRPGGRIFVKDTDLQSDFFWPVPFDTYAKVMGVIVKSQSKLIDGGYDPFFARNVPSLLAKISGLTMSTFSQSFSFFAPLSIEERNYVRANAAMISELAAQNGATDEADEWYALFHGTGGICVLDSPDFMYSMNEFVFQAVLV